MSNNKQIKLVQTDQKQITRRDSRGTRIYWKNQKKIRLKRLTLKQMKYVGQIRTCMIKIFKQKINKNKAKKLNQQLTREVEANESFKQIKLSILIVVRAYFGKIGLRKTSDFININKQFTMPKSLEMKSKNKLRRLPTMSLIFQGVDSQSWVYYPQHLDYVINFSSFTIIPKSIQCYNNDLVFKGKLFYPNGRPFYLAEECKKQFLQKANKNGNKVCFFTQQDGKQLLLQCNIFFDSNLSAEEKILNCLQCIENCERNFDEALQLIGLKKRNTLFGCKMFREQLNLRKNVSQILNKNSVTQQIVQRTNQQQQNKSVFRVASITEKSDIFSQQKKIKKGGFFQVQKKVSYVQHQSGEIQEKVLACKTPIHQNFALNEQKMKRQIDLVETVVDDKHLAKYYLVPTEPTKIYMDYVSGSYKDAIYSEKLNMQQLFGLNEQLVEAIKILHKSNLVHRDLKPENILIEGQTLKIIDYCESVNVNQNFTENHGFGCTLPYSPFECVLGRAEGFNKKQIDLWSIAIILYEMTFKSIPLFYSRFIGNQIVQKWREGFEFSISPLYRKLHGLRSIEHIISQICIRGLQVKPEQRLSLKSYSQLLSLIKDFYIRVINYA